MKKELKNINHQLIPDYVSQATNVLEKAGFEAYLVGGCVRDLLMDKEPKDWDVTTSARPDQIIKLFEKTVYENTFGTVGVYLPTKSFQKKDDVPHETLGGVVSCETKYKIIEVTPYRIEAKYSDFRHPDEVKFSDNLEDDLKRRDFTVNALAFRFNGPTESLKDFRLGRYVVDLYKGQQDIKDKILRTVGNSNDRFKEDPLRMLRAVRFAVQLDFSISHETSESILENSHLIEKISAERIRDEFVKIIMSSNPSTGIVMLQKFGLLKYIVPELEEGINCEQSGEHIYDVFNHLLHALSHASGKNWPLEIRLSALFHDIGKPKSRRLAVPAGKKKYTFYGHEVVSERLAKKILERLKFPKKEIELITKLVRSHMFFSDTEQITLSAVRRIIVKVGQENIWLLMNVRECDRVGMKKKETPYRLRKYFAMIEEVLHDPISVSQLKINGEFLIKNLGIKPGPRMGWILNALLEEVIDDPTKNNEKYLSKLVKSFDLLPDGKLKTLGDRGKEKKEEVEEKEVEKLHQKHGVKK